MTSPNQPAGPGSAGFFDKLGDHYDEAIVRCVPRYHEMLDQMLDYLDPRIERPAILELGCGSGNLTEKLVRKYPDSAVQAVDASSRMIEIAGQRFQHFDRIVFLQQAFQELQLPADSLDLVVSSIAIHHLQDSEKQELFLRIREWLRPGDVLTFCDQLSGATDRLYRKHMANWRQAARELGATDQQWHQWMEHQREHDFHSSLQTHCELLRIAGFENVDCTRRFFLWTTLICQ